MDWVDKAEEDFQFAIVNLKEQKPFYAQICFHFHQAAEKFLKAYVVANELEFRKVHDLPLLLRICSAKDSALEALGDACEYLSDAGILPKEFTEKIKGMPAFRNRIIHDYLPNEIDAIRLFETLQGLDDFKKFSKYILAWLKKNDDVP
jgi:HEPN domain-containing protein